MANNQQLTVGSDIVDYHSQYGYPVTGFVLQAQSDGKKIHVIFDSAAVGTSYTKAPNGSVHINFTITTCVISVKDYGTNGAGGIDGTWRSASLT